MLTVVVVASQHPLQLLNFIGLIGIDDGKLVVGMPQHIGLLLELLDELRCFEDCLFLQEVLVLESLQQIVVGALSLRTAVE